jgi:hypothetical protein
MYLRNVAAAFCCSRVAPAFCRMWEQSGKMPVLLSLAPLRTGVFSRNLRA